MSSGGAGNPLYTTGREGELMMVMGGNEQALAGDLYVEHRQVRSIERLGGGGEGV
jgi:hypothetical protein